MKCRKDYAKKSENITRNRMIASMWQQMPDKTVQQIADTFNVSVGTVYNAIHKYIEYDNPIYDMLMTANDRLENGYSQGTVTRAFIALRRYYPEMRTVPQFVHSVIGAELDTLPSMSVAIDTLINEAKDMVTESYGNTTQFAAIKESQ